MRAFAPVFKDLARRYTPMGFDFVVVYILEAHAEVRRALKPFRVLYFPYLFKNMKKLLACY